MDPFILWAFVVIAIIAMIIFSMVSSRLRERKIRRLRRELMPVVPASIRSGVYYNVFLSNGTVFKGVKVVGLTDAPLGQRVDFPLESWLVLENPEGKAIYIKPSSARYFEEV